MAPKRVPPEQDEIPITSAEEREQIQQLFELSAAQLELLLGGCAYIFEQAAYATTPADGLHAELTAAGLADAWRLTPGVGRPLRSPGRSC